MSERIIHGIPVNIVRKSIRSMNLSVRAPEGTVRLSVPKRTSMRTIERFVAEHIDWIQTQQARIRRLHPPHAYVSGETIYSFGFPLRLLVQTGSRGTAVRAGTTLLLTAPEDSTAEQRAKLIARWQRAQLQELAGELLDIWASRIGVEVREWHIKRMRTKWGTCNYTAHRIWLSLALAEKPVECVEYVVVHELCHLLEPSHSARFWGYVERYLPDWRERKKQLNDPTEKSGDA